MSAGVVTGEAVALDMRLARWPSRMVALVIDLAVQYGLFLVVTIALAALHTDSDLASAIMLVAVVVVVMGYPIAFESLWRGRSLGKAALGLRVVRDDGGPERFRHALVRGVLLPFEVWGPALIASMVSKRGKRIGDLLAGTIVVQERVPGRTALPTSMPPQLAWWASTLDLSRLGDDLALSCRHFLSRQHELRPAAREAMGSQLVAAVQAVVTPAPPPGTPGWAYLAAVVAERRRREEWRLYTAAQARQPAPAARADTPYAAYPAYGQPTAPAPLPYGRPDGHSPATSPAAASNGHPPAAASNGHPPAVPNQPPPGPFTPPA